MRSVRNVKNTKSCRMIADSTVAKKPAAPRKPRSPAKAKPKDLALVVGPTADEEGFHVLRRRSEDAPVEMGTVRPMKEGEPIDGEVVSMRPRKDVPYVYDVKTVMPDRKPRGERRLTSDGPPQVATEDYRRGWDKIWGKGRAKDTRLN